MGAVEYLITTLKGCVNLFCNVFAYLSTRLPLTCLQ